MNEKPALSRDWPRGLLLLGISLLQGWPVAERIHNAQDEWLVSHSIMAALFFACALPLLLPKLRGR